MKRLSLVLMICGALPAFAQITVIPGEPASSSARATPVPTLGVQADQPVKRAEVATPVPSPTPKAVTHQGAIRRFFGFRWLSGSDHKKAGAVTATSPAVSPTPAPQPGEIAKVAPVATPAVKLDQKVKRAEVAVPSPSPTPKPVHHQGAIGRFFSFHWLSGSDHKKAGSVTPAASPAPSHQAGKTPVLKPGVTKPKTSKVTPSVTPSATPAPTPKPKKTQPSPKTAAQVQPAATPAAAPAATPKLSTHKPHPTATAAPSPIPTPSPTVSESAPPVVSPALVRETSGHGNGELETRYRQIREQAGNDPHVAALRQKLETAPEGGPYKAAAHQYIKALFSRIRAIDPDLGQAVSRKEGAYNRRIDLGKPLAD